MGRHVAISLKKKKIQKERVECGTFCEKELRNTASRDPR